MLASDQWNGCPVRFGMGVFGDKWTLLIIRDLMFKGKRHFGEFHDSEEGISTNILSDRLSKLERNGILLKQRDSKNQAKYIYSLSDKGLDLIPMMLAMIDWAERYDENTAVPPAFIALYRSDPQTLEQQIRNRLVVVADNA